MIVQALLSLRPGASWTLNGETLDGLVWNDQVQTRPTDDEINAKAAELALPTLKKRLLKQVDDDAEACRLKYITGGVGMAMTYREKFEQAKAVNAFGQSAANAMTVQEYTAAYPTLAASVGIEAATLWDCSQVVITRYEAFATVSNPIETARLSGKAAVTAAADDVAAQSAYQATKASFDAIAANA